MINHNNKHNNKKMQNMCWDALHTITLNYEPQKNACPRETICMQTNSIPELFSNISKWTANVIWSKM